MNVKLVAISQPRIADHPEIRTAEDLIVYCARVSNPANQSNTDTAPKLLAFCIRKRHWSIFEQATMTVEIETSRAIAAQVLRHKSAAFQEFSQRYASVDAIGDHLFEPVELRLKAKGGNRQGSVEGEIPFVEWNGQPTRADAAVDDLLAAADGLYRELISVDVAPECARMALPLCTRTRMYMTAPVRTWIHYLMQRTDSHAQKEHRLVALKIAEIFGQEFPNIAQALANFAEYAAQSAYEAYCEHRGWKSFRGEQLPLWMDVEEDVKQGWRMAAKSIL